MNDQVGHFADDDDDDALVRDEMRLIELQSNGELPLDGQLCVTFVRHVLEVIEQITSR